MFFVWARTLLPTAICMERQFTRSMRIATHTKSMAAVDFEFPDSSMRALCGCFESCMTGFEGKWTNFRHFVLSRGRVSKLCKKNRVFFYFIFIFTNMDENKITGGSIEYQPSEL